MPFLPCHPLKLYAVVPNAAWVKRLAGLAVPTIQLRFKPEAQQAESAAGLAQKPLSIAATAAVHAEVAAAVQAVAGTSSKLIVNDYWQIALAAAQNMGLHRINTVSGLYGIHLGQEDLDMLGAQDIAALAASGLRLGISTHQDDELERALALRPSYVAFGSIFPTTTKQLKTAPQGLEKLCRFVQHVAQWAIDAQCPRPQTVAIGGVDATNAAAVMSCGVDGFAVVRAITQARDTIAAVNALKAFL